MSGVTGHASRNQDNVVVIGSRLLGGLWGRGYRLSPLTFLARVRARKLRRLAAAEIRPHISSSVAASGAHEAGLDIRQANIVRPAIGAQSNVVTAMAVDQ